MKLILFIILLSFGCSNSDDLFFVLNPNKKNVLDKEKRECIRDTFAFAIAGLNNRKQFIDGSCDDPNSLSRKENPDIIRCKEKALRGFEILILARLISCPKDLTE